MRRLGLALTILLLAVIGLLPAAAAPAPANAVIETMVIGHSVQGRAIKAYRLGEPGKPVHVLIATMHGNERDTRQILQTLRDGKPIANVDLWVVPDYNPDGFARGTRRNARGVDLNRNFPYAWAPLTGNYYSGPRPASEPETRAMMGFLKQVRPRRVLSFHQPLLGVDVATKDGAFARRLARALRLPTTNLDCNGTCHGTMTGWFNNRFAGAALTIEYGYHPSRHTLRQQAPYAVLRTLGGDYSQKLTNES